MKRLYKIILIIKKLKESDIHPWRQAPRYPVTNIMKQYLRILLIIILTSIGYSAVITVVTTIDGTEL